MFKLIKYTIIFLMVVVSVSIIYAGQMKRYVFSWQSDASGDFTLSNPSYMNGILYRVCFNPTDGSAPSEGYDVSFNQIDGDGSNIDAFEGIGANLSRTTSTCFVPLTNNAAGTDAEKVAVADKLTLKVENAGPQTKGEVVIYIGE